MFDPVPADALAQARARAGGGARPT
jgi:hypothetical protein